MARTSPLASVLMIALLLPAFTGCGGQQSGPTQVAEQAEQAPPPYSGSDSTASEVPPPPPAKQKTAQGSIPEERPRRIVPEKPAPPPTVTLAIPAGTALSVTLDQPLTSETAQAGDKVTATLKESILVGDRVALPAGSRVEGTVTDVKHAKKGFKDTGGALALSFHRVVTPKGTAVTIAAGLSKLAEGSAGKKAAIIGGSAAGGALLGKVLDKDAAGAAVVGAAVGTAVAGSTKGKEAKIGTEEVLSVALEQAAKITLPR